MARPLWSGMVTFGLLNIPVTLVSSTKDRKIHFNMLDKTNHARIGYKQYNKVTGKEVSRDQIVKGYEIEPEHFVMFTDKDFEIANPKATHYLEIADFVNLADLDPLLFEKPYYLLPGKNGEKGYVLLREVMQQRKKIAIGTFVLHQKQRLVAIMPRGDYLVCEVLRYAHEILTDKDLDEKIKDVAISKREIDIASQLVEGMTASWDPDKYKDTYYDDIMKLIRRKAKSGRAVESEEPVLPEESSTKIADIIPLLKKSLQTAGKKRPSGKPSARRRA